MFSISDRYLKLKLVIIVYYNKYHSVSPLSTICTLDFDSVFIYQFL